MTRALPDFRLETFFSRWEFACRWNLAASDAETWTVDGLLALEPEARERLLALGLGYLPTWGTDELREAVAATYETVQPEDVLVFAGAEEAIYWTLQELCPPGSRALVTVPNYQSLESVALAAGASVEGVPLWDSAGRWALDLDRLEASLASGAALVAVNFPNNPTGWSPRREDFERLVALCGEVGARLFSDEVYRGVELDPGRTLPQAADLDERAVSLGVLSKAYGLPGLRVGWVATRDRELLQRLERRKHWTSICNAGPSELLAALALRHAGRLRARTRALVERNVERVGALLASRPDLFDWQPPVGGCVAYVGYRGRDGADAFCTRLVEERGVLLLPGSVFSSAVADVPVEGFRIGLGRAGVEPALDELAALVGGVAG